MQCSGDTITNIILLLTLTSEAWAEGYSSCSVCLSVCLCVSAITRKQQVVTISYFQKLLFCIQGRTSAMFYSHWIFGKYDKSNKCVRH